MAGVEVRRLAELPQHVDTVTRWVAEEWNDPTRSLAARRESLLDPPDCPATLLALSAGAPLGVLGFARFQRAGEQHRSLWVNALYVDPAARRRGVGTLLLDAAVRAAAGLERQLFVYTALRAWYEARGWSLIQASDAGLCVLVRDLSRP